MNNVPALTPTYILASLTTVVSLFLTQGLIDNNTSKLVTGLASVFIPAALAIAHSLFAGRVKAAKIAAGVEPVAPVTPAPPLGSVR